MPVGCKVEERIGIFSRLLFFDAWHFNLSFLTIHLGCFLLCLLDKICSNLGRVFYNMHKFFGCLLSSREGIHGSFPSLRVDPLQDGTVLRRFLSKYVAALHWGSLHLLRAAVHHLAVTHLVSNHLDLILWLVHVSETPIVRINCHSEVSVLLGGDISEIVSKFSAIQLL